MATVQNVYRGKTAWLIDDKIQVEFRGRTIRLRDAVTGQVIQNIGDEAGAKTRAELLISSGKWATHQGHVNYNVTPNS
ncbi:MAG: hypothetical protein IID53_15230 [Proteobacteria bacterium]|nr:hypothetical protein [Pseudomonadota bacterium]